MFVLLNKYVRTNKKGMKKKSQQLFGPALNHPLLLLNVSFEFNSPYFNSNYIFICVTCHLNTFLF